jgi:hypothetical protein
MKRTTKDWKARLAIGSLIGIAILITGAVAVLGQPKAHSAEIPLEEYDPFVIAAEVLDLTEDELDAALAEDVSLAQISRDRSVDPEAIVRAIVDADAAQIDQALANGEIDEREAISLRDFAYASAVDFVYLPLVRLLPGEFDALEQFDVSDDWEVETFEGESGWFEEEEAWFGDGNLGLFPLAFGIEPQHVMGIEVQRTMAMSLLADGVAPEAVVEAVLEAEVSLFDQLLGFVVGLFAFDLGFGSQMEYGVEAQGDDLIVLVAEVLGLEEDAVWDTLDEGGTIAALAEANGVDPQAIIDALMVEENEMIDALLADGELTEEEAAEWRLQSLEMMQEIVHEPWL